MIEILSTSGERERHNTLPLSPFGHLPTQLYFSFQETAFLRDLMLIGYHKGDSEAMHLEPNWTETDSIVHPLI